MVWRGFGFQEIGDAEGVFEGIELSSLLGDLGPGGECFAGFIGIGEDDDLVIDERGEEFGFEHLEATTGEPDAFWAKDRTDDGGLLGLNDTDG